MIFCGVIWGVNHLLTPNQRFIQQLESLINVKKMIWPVFCLNFKQQVVFKPIDL